MADLRFEFDPDTLAGDLVASDTKSLDLDSGLATAVYLSLFCDRRADPSDDVPRSSEPWPDRRGWWGDPFARIEGYELGSRLWILHRSVLTTAMIARARQYVTEALEWLLELGLASAVDVSLTVPSRGRLEISVTVTGPTGEDSAFGFIWDAMRERV